jgi:hypothetical protein
VRLTGNLPRTEIKYPENTPKIGLNYDLMSALRRAEAIEALASIE